MGVECNYINGNGARSSRCSAARQRGRSRRARSRRAHANRESSHGDCRKTGDLPLDICAEDDSRTTIGLQREPDESDPRDHAQGWVDYLREDMPNSYRPFVFWDDQKVYVEVAVEKLDLRNLFESACAEFYVPISNLIDCVRSMLTY